MTAKYEWQLWINYGQGWEHELTENSRVDMQARVREYRKNSPEWPRRVRCVKVKE